MATQIPGLADRSRTEMFFPATALVMAAVIVIGFSTHYLMGRSTFARPALWHLHGVAFMGWVALFVVQSSTGASRSLALHRRLGWLAAGWSVVLVVLGIAITVRVVREGIAPFFFQPQHFLIANPLTVLVFAGLTAAAVRLRQRTDWHRRLHLTATAAIMGPGFGRLLPMPLMGPFAFQIVVLIGLIFPIAGMVRDYRREGRVHPAWLVGVGAILLVIPLAYAVAFSPIGDAAYAAVTQGAAGAAVDGRVAAPAPPLP